MFSSLKQTFFSFFSTATKKLFSIFGEHGVTDQELDKFFEILVCADVGVAFSRGLISNLKKQRDDGILKGKEDVAKSTEEYLLKTLESAKTSLEEPDVIALIGINGSGKTTTCAKLANMYKEQGLSVLVVAADTFRAAAAEQLSSWTRTVGVDIFLPSKQNQDPAAVIYDAANYAKEKKYDKIIIDTAGRIHTSDNLLQELSKSLNVCKKVFSDKKIGNWIVLDSTLGQSLVEQVRFFGQSSDLHGIIFTKLDGTSKGGAIFSIVQEFLIPVLFLTVAENDLRGIKKFDARICVSQFIGQE